LGERANKSFIVYTYDFRTCQIAVSQFFQCKFLSLKYIQTVKAVYFIIYHYFIQLLPCWLSHHVWFYCQLFLVHYRYRMCFALN
jgi:hypothetical protein